MAKNETKTEINDEQSQSKDTEQQTETVDNQQEQQKETEETDKESAAKDVQPEDELKKAQEELAEEKDKYLRLAAEFDNYRKRTRKEMSDILLNGSEKTVTAILPVMDDMERAIANSDKAESAEKLEEGWELIVKKLHQALEGLGVKQIDTKDADFDVDYHEAVAMVPGQPDDKKGKVIDCMQTGYTLNGKVIRHAKVAVGQ